MAPYLAGQFDEIAVNSRQEIGERELDDLLHPATTVVDHLAAQVGDWTITLADVDAIVDAILRVSQLVTDYADEIEELDINPLVVFSEGAKAVDALVTRRRT